MGIITDQNIAVTETIGVNKQTQIKQITPTQIIQYHYKTKDLSNMYYYILGTMTFKI